MLVLFFRTIFNVFNVSGFKLMNGWNFNILDLNKKQTKSLFNNIKTLMGRHNIASKQISCIVHLR